MNNLRIGDAVVYVDPVGVQRPAVVSAIWSQRKEPSDRSEYYNAGPSLGEYCLATEQSPCINVVYVSGDQAKHDSYGRQIERATSVVHRDGQTAHGNYWRRLDEEPKETERAA